MAAAVAAMASVTAQETAGRQAAATRRSARPAWPLSSQPSAGGVQWSGRGFRWRRRCLRLWPRWGWGQPERKRGVGPGLVAGAGRRRRRFDASCQRRWRSWRRRRDAQDRHLVDGLRIGRHHGIRTRRRWLSCHHGRWERRQRLRPTDMGRQSGRPSRASDVATIN